MTASQALPRVVPRAPLDDAVAGPALAAAAQGRLLALELLSDVAVRVAGSVHLGETLQTIADAVVESLGFDAAVLNLVTETSVPVAAVTGPQELQDALLGTAQPLEVWEAMLARSVPLGNLRFVDGRAGDDLDGMLSWVPDIAVSQDPDAWHPQDALFAPLHGTGGDLVGVLSVDLPRDGRRPDATGVELLERFAMMAALAIQRARMHQDAADSATLFRRMFEDAPLGMALLGLDGRVEQTNATYAAMIGRERTELTGLFCWDLVHAEDRESIRTAIGVVANKDSPIVEGEVRNVSGEQWGRATASRIDGPTGARVLVQMVDVTEQRRTTRLLRSQATTDILTGLSNRAGLNRQLQALLDKPRVGGDRVAVIFCDLDLFKLVNDTHGHAAGDELLMHVARVLQGELRGADVAARFGGDEFVVVLDSCAGPGGAIATAERIRAALSRPVTVAGGALVLSLSMGIAIADASSTTEQLLADADTALYRAKDGGGGEWELFAPDMRDKTVSRLRLREDLRDALADGQFRLHYQPLVDLSTGWTTGFEALLRWEHPERGLLLPADFLDELMHGNLSCAATDWVIRSALEDAATWPEEHGHRPFVSINISPQQLGRVDLTAVIAEHVRRVGIDPDRVWIEVTEEALVAGSAQLSALAALRALGLHVALDDFGSGYAGLLALRDVPADVVKLDREFTRSLLTDSTTRSIVESVVALCARLGRTLVAEGLETAQDVAALQDLGLGLGQGWHLGRPGPLPPVRPPTCS